MNSIGGEVVGVALDIREPRRVGRPCPSPRPVVSLRRRQPVRRAPVSVRHPDPVTGKGQPRFGPIHEQTAVGRGDRIVEPARRDHLRLACGVGPVSDLPDGLLSRTDQGRRSPRPPTRVARVEDPWRAEDRPFRLWLSARCRWPQAHDPDRQQRCGNNPHYAYKDSTARSLRPRRAHARLARWVFSAARRLQGCRCGMSGERRLPSRVARACRLRGRPGSGPRRPRAASACRRWRRSGPGRVPSSR